MRKGIIGALPIA